MYYNFAKIKMWPRFGQQTVSVREYKITITSTAIL